MLALLVAFLLLLPLTPVSAQLRPGALGATEAPLYWVDGRPLLRVQLVAGPKLYTCHLLLDLARPQALFLHENAAGVLRSSSATVRSGGLELPNLPLRAARITWLEEFTKQHAQELQEIPVAGALGISAFGNARVEIDGPAGVLRLSEGGAEQRPRPARGGVVVELLEDATQSGLRVRLRVRKSAETEESETSSAARSRSPAIETREIRALVHSGEASSLIDPALAQALHAPHGVLNQVLLAASAAPEAGAVGGAQAGSVPLHRMGVFFPYQVPKGVQMTLGGRLLRQLRISFESRGNWLLVEPVAEPVFPEDEAALHRALFAEDSLPRLREFLAAHPESEFRPDAAKEFINRALQAAVSIGDPQGELVLEAARASIEAAPAGRNAEEAFRILGELPASLAELRVPLLRYTIEVADPSSEPDRIFQARLELGRIARRDGDMREARRHLLSAAFGLPGDGRVQLELGRMHEAQGRLDRARGAYVLALLDTEQTGEVGLLQLQALHPKLPERDRPLAQLLREWTDGRIPGFHPLPRDPEEIRPTGRIVLAELFTGAQCPPCEGADLAMDALAEHLGPKELVTIQWHLPVPAPEPMIAPVSRQRSQRVGVRGTPTMAIGGVEVSSGGGDREVAPELFAKMLRLAKREAARPLRVQLAGEGSADRDSVQAQVHVQPRDESGETAALRLHAILIEDTLIFPGSNGILFHSQVARARLTPLAGLPIDKATSHAPAQLSARIADIEAELDAAVRAVERDGPFRIRPTQLDPRQLALVVFVEDTSTAVGGTGVAEVVQALRVPLRFTGPTEEDK
jgi:tetratricopeptide (TPR) repeat protein